MKDKNYCKHWLTVNLLGNGTKECDANKKAMSDDAENTKRKK